ncbi:MAG: hypothetical protein HQ491_05365 [Bacteroidetes bacterium]|nr:hypothetical protein [Bacteroidota bacterium]
MTRLPTPTVGAAITGLFADVPRAAATSKKRRRGEFRTRKGMGRNMH